MPRSDPLQRTYAALLAPWERESRKMVGEKEDAWNDWQRLARQAPMNDWMDVTSASLSGNPTRLFERAAGRSGKTVREAVRLTCEHEPAAPRQGLIFDTERAPAARSSTCRRPRPSPGAKPLPQGAVVAARPRARRSDRTRCPSANAANRPAPKPVALVPPTPITPGADRRADRDAHVDRRRVQREHDAPARGRPARPDASAGRP